MIPKKNNKETGKAEGNSCNNVSKHECKYCSEAVRAHINKNNGLKMKTDIYIYIH